MRGTQRGGCKEEPEGGPKGGGGPKGATQRGNQRGGGDPKCGGKPSFSLGQHKKAILWWGGGLCGFLSSQQDPHARDPHLRHKAEKKPLKRPPPTFASHPKADKATPTKPPLKKNPTGCSPHLRRPPHDPPHTHTQPAPQFVDSPQHDQLAVFDGLLVGRAVLLRAGRKHGAAAANAAIIP